MCDAFFKSERLQVFASAKELERAKELVQGYRTGTLDADEETLRRAKILYDSAYHPSTGEKVFLLGRMSFQVSGTRVGNLTVQRFPETC